MKNPTAIIEKLEAQSASERALGNHDAADAFSAKAKAMRLKYNLPLPEPVKEQPKAVSTVLPRPFHSNFPGVPPIEAPLTNAQLQALRSAAAFYGRPLTDQERARILGLKDDHTQQPNAPRDVVPANSFWI